MGWLINGQVSTRPVVSTEIGWFASATAVVQTKVLEVDLTEQFGVELIDDFYDLYSVSVRSRIFVPPQPGSVTPRVPVEMSSYYPAVQIVVKNINGSVITVLEQRFLDIQLPEVHFTNAPTSGYATDITNPESNFINFSAQGGLPGISLEVYSQRGAEGSLSLDCLLLRAGVNLTSGQGVDFTTTWFGVNY
jgi:hypothetical protein